MTLVIVPLAVIAVGVAIAVLRFRRREQWDSAHGRWES
jgi:NADH:ubiquinone oxidoreductase subunit K